MVHMSKLKAIGGLITQMMMTIRFTSMMIIILGKIRGVIPMMARKKITHGIILIAVRGMTHGITPIADHGIITTRGAMTITQIADHGIVIIRMTIHGAKIVTQTVERGEMDKLYEMNKLVLILIYFAGLIVSSITWGAIKEQFNLHTTKDKKDSTVDTIFMILWLPFWIALVFYVIAILFTGFFIGFGRGLVKLKELRHGKE